MKIRTLFLLIILSLGLMNKSNAQSKVTFKANDGLTVTADEYMVEGATRYIVLCHQAAYSRGEYNETAKRLNKLGFNCLAIDQRSGGEINGVKNETAALAESSKKPTTYLDAEKDINAAIEYAFEKSNSHNVILLGSSYSASLALKVGFENDKVSAIIAFSPGEYFDKKLNVANTVDGLKKPVWVTCTQKESPEVNKIMKSIDSKNKVLYIPTNEGVHGSKALWKSQVGNEEYWIKLIPFLDSIRNL
jgi:dienelactone hydrolase